MFKEIKTEIFKNRRSIRIILIIFYYLTVFMIASKIIGNLIHIYYLFNIKVDNGIIPNYLINLRFLYNSILCLLYYSMIYGIIKKKNWVYGISAITLIGSSFLDLLWQLHFPERIYIQLVYTAWTFLFSSIITKILILVFVKYLVKIEWEK